MPGNILNADTGFPQFTGEESSDQKIDRVMNYLYMLLEQLRYTLNNLDADNFNDTGLKEIAEGIAKPLATSFENELMETNALIEGWSSEFGSQIKLLTDWKDEATESIASVQVAAGQNEAKITALTSWQSSAEGELDGLAASVASIEEIADANGASISQIVSAVGKDGKVNAASIVSAVNGAGSSVMIDADRIRMTGEVVFLTADDVGDGGTTEISGDRISLRLDGTDDDGETDLSSDNGLRFEYVTSRGYEREFADIYTSIDGNDSDETSRYALNLSANRFYNEDGDQVFASIKMDAAGRVSVNGQFGIYLGTYSNEGYISLDALDNTRIFAPKDYDDMIYASGASYVFCADGIYYNGKRVVDNSKEV